MSSFSEQLPIFTFMTDEVKVSTYKYEIRDYEKIIYNGNDYQLPSDVIQRIIKLSKKIESSSKRPTHTIASSRHQVVRHTNPVHVINTNKTENVWKRPEPIKTTVINVEKTQGFSMDLQTLRTHINKLSSANFDTMLEKIRDIMMPYTDSNEQFHQLCVAIFMLPCSSSFACDNISHLCKELITSIPKMAVELETDITQYKHSIDGDFIPKMKITNDNKDEYEKHENTINKRNDKRKGFSTWLRHLVKHKLVTVNTLYDIIEHYMFQFEQLINTPNSVAETNELTENIFLLVNNNIDILYADSRWNIIYEKIVSFSTTNVKNVSSFSTRAKFKYCDIIQTFNQETNK